MMLGGGVRRWFGNPKIAYLYCKQVKLYLRAEEVSTLLRAAR